MKHVYSISVLVLIAFTLPLAAHASSAGKISGVVRDARTKETIPGVNVRVDGTTLGASTNADGHYVILNVPPGLHTVVASYIGYKRAVVRDVRVSTNFTTTLDFSMQEGDIQADEVVVQGERSPLIRKDLTNPVASISAETITELPVTEISEVIGLQAGITVDDGGGIHIRGGLGNEIAYTLNGISINNPYANTRSVGLATNAVQEVSVSSGTFNAEYGNALSGVVNYVTKEGGTKWTGSLKVLTGDHLSANKDLFFNIDQINLNNVNRYEASVGGPILGDDLTFYASGVYSWFGGYLYAEQYYLPTDAHLLRSAFPSGDPRRGSSSDPLYFAPFSRDTSDRVGGPSGNRKIAPLNWSQSYNLQGNIRYRLSPTTRLKYEIVYNNTMSPSSSSIAYRFKPDGRSMSYNEAYFHSLEWTHSLGERAFYTLKGSYILDKGKSYAYENINDPRYLPAFYQTVLPNTSFYTGGVDLGRFFRTSTAISGKFDLVAQLLDNHEVKFGAEVRSHKLEVESYTLRFGDPSNPDRTFTVEDLVRGTKLLPFIPDINAGYVKYTRRPLQITSYLQDKIELFTSIILNLGVRYEFFDPAAEYNPNLTTEYFIGDSLGFYSKGNVKAKKKHMLAPRLSVSYPITDRGTIRFSYGHFYQIGSLSSLYSNPYFRAVAGTTPSFGNPNVSPQRSVQYELGLQQGLTDDLRLEITGYYKDVSDYIVTQRIETARGDKPYFLLTNLNYANTRGVSISLLKRRSPGELFSATLDYTFQIAEGNRTEPSEEIFFNEQRGQLTETFLVPFSFDRSHTLTSTLTLSQPNDWSVGFIAYVRTGTPYTPGFPSNVVPISFQQNSDRQPLQWNVDMKIEKFFDFGGIGTSFFVQVDNLFDTKNELDVYASSGSALYDINTVLNPNRFADIRSRIRRGDPGLIPESVLDNIDANPRNISAPRLVRFGVSLLF